MKAQRTLTPWTVASLFAVPLTLVLGSVAQAQTTVPPISVQIGAGYLTDNSARDAAGDGGLHAGISYDLPGKSLLSTLHSRPSIDLDYNHTAGHGGHADVLGVSYTERISIGNGVTDVATHGARPYVGVGVGAFRTDVRHTKTTTNALAISGAPGSGVSDAEPRANNTSTTSESDNGWGVGGKILAGLDFGKTFVEASYQISGSKLGVRTDTANLSVGVHF